MTLTYVGPSIPTKRLSFSHRWTITAPATDPEFRVLLGSEVGTHTARNEPAIADPVNYPLLPPILHSPGFLAARA